MRTIKTKLNAWGMFKRDWQLHMFMLLPMIYLLIFAYYPMFGIQIAFKDFVSAKGIWGSKWIGMKHFKTFFNSYQFWRVLKNTLRISLYNILAGFPLPILFALMLNAIPKARFKKLIQTVSYMPHFISVVVVVGMINQVFNPITGLFGFFYKFFGGIGYPDSLLGNPKAFDHIYVWSGVWQTMGWSSIIYIAALAGVSPELHEAAIIDGATRWKRVLYIDFPYILPTASVLLILRSGSIMSIGFEKIYLLQNALNLTKSEVISTYVYKVGMESGGDFSYATAIGLFNSVINCMLLVLVNLLSRKLSSDNTSLW